MLIPNFVRQALAGEPLIVHGDGSQTRSFTWVGDVVSALLVLVQEPRSVGDEILERVIAYWEPQSSGCGLARHATASLVTARDFQFAGVLQPAQ